MIAQPRQRLTHTQLCITRSILHTYRAYPVHTRAYMFAHIHELFPTSRLTIRLLYNMLLLAVLHSDGFKCPSDFRRLQSPSDFRRPQCPSDVPTSDAPTFRRLSCAEKKSVAVSASAPPQPYRLATAPTFTRLSDLSDGASTPIQYRLAQRLRRLSDFPTSPTGLQRPFNF